MKRKTKKVPPTDRKDREVKVGKKVYWVLNPHRAYVVMAINQVNHANRFADVNISPDGKKSACWVPTYELFSSKEDFLYWNLDRCNAHVETAISNLATWQKELRMVVSGLRQA